MIPAKLEDFTVLSDVNESRVCMFIDPKSFEHPVNKARFYLKKARDKGEREADNYVIPEQLKEEFDGLLPIILSKGEKLYVANPDFSPCSHGWSNIHANNKEYAVVNENSAVPLNLITAKPPVKEKYAKNLNPPKGSADMTTDYFKRGRMVYRKPLLEGHFKG
jgi:hypothetical protein